VQWPVGAKRPRKRLPNSQLLRKVKHAGSGQRMSLQWRTAPVPGWNIASHDLFRPSHRRLEL
jgi:hypothetical protein